LVNGSFISSTTLLAFIFSRSIILCASLRLLISSYFILIGTILEYICEWSSTEIYLLLKDCLLRPMLWVYALRILAGELYIISLLFFSTTSNFSLNFLVNGGLNSFSNTFMFSSGCLFWPYTSGRCLFEDFKFYFFPIVAHTKIFSLS